MSRKPARAYHEAPTRSAPARAKAELEFEEATILGALFGQFDANLVLIENRLGVYISARGNRAQIEGPEDGVARARDVLKAMHQRLIQGHELDSGTVESIIAMSAEPTLEGIVTGDHGAPPIIIRTRKKTIVPRSAMQIDYMRALASKDSATSGLLQTTVTVEQSVGMAWANLVVAGASIDATRKQIGAAQKAFDGVREEAKLGARTTLDVLTAEQDLLAARVSRLQAEADRYIGVYNLLASMGLLTVEHLKLGVPTYDPEAYYDAVKDAPAASAQGKRLDRILKKIGN